MGRPAKRRKKTPHGDDVIAETCSRRKLASGVVIEICEVDREDDAGPARRGVYARATHRRSEVANIMGLLDGRRLRVESVEVDSAARGVHVGTALYEELLAYACSRGLRLASDTFRSPFAEAFWQKQLRKDRAVCGESGTGEVYVGPVREMRNQLAADEFMAVIERLPRPAVTPEGNAYWPCRAYEIKPELCGARGARPSLAGLGGRIEVTAKRVKTDTVLEARSGESMVSAWCSPETGHCRVHTASVVASDRRKKLGTTLYEHLLAKACGLGFKLTSGVDRTPYSEAFWRKQVGKGRATCAVTGDGAGYENTDYEGREISGPDLPQPVLRSVTRRSGRTRQELRWPCQEFAMGCAHGKPGGLHGLGYPPDQPCGLTYENFRSGWTYGEAYEQIAYQPESKGTSQRAVLRALRELKQAEYERYLSDCEQAAESAGADPADVPTLRGLR